MLSDVLPEFHDKQQNHGSLTYSDESHSKDVHKNEHSSNDNRMVQGFTHQSSNCNYLFSPTFHQNKDITCRIKSYKSYVLERLGANLTQTLPLWPASQAFTSLFKKILD